MKRYFLIIALLATTSVGLLYSLPRVVVNNKEEKVASETKKTATRQDTTSTNSKSTEVAHSQSFTPVQEKEQKRLMSGLSNAQTVVSKVAAALAVSDWYTNLKRFDSAAKYAEVVVQLDPTVPHFMLAADRYYDAYTFVIDAEKANALGEKTRQWYQKALDKNPDLLAAKANMAMTYVTTNNPMQGIALLRQVLDTDPTNELALFNLGMLSMRSNQYQKAADRFAKIVNINPQNTKARFYWGVSLAQLGKNKEALEVLAVVKKTEKDPAIQAAIGELEQDLK